jgi:uncharacterized protein (DUF2267 family)
MDEVIKMVANKIGVDEAVARQAVGAVLNFLKENHGKVDFQAIVSKLQGAEDLMNDREVVAVTAEAGAEKAAAPTGGTGGILGLIFTLLKAFGVIALLKQLLQPIFGDSVVKMIDSVEDGAELAAIMSKLGINRDQAIKVVQTLITFMKDKLDSDTIDKLTEQIPAVKALLGESKKDE